MKKNTMFAIVCAGGLLACNAIEPVGTGKQNMKKQVISNNQTGLDLYGKLKSKEGNIVISPYSIGSAMTMALAGADGDTRVEMAKVMHQIMGDKQMNPAVSTLYKTINTLAGKDVVFETANGLCLTQDGQLVSDAYKKLLLKDFHAELFTAANVSPINNWVKKKTHGKIPKLLDSLPANPVCVLLNAVYFKGLWSNQFRKQSTRDAWFFREGAKKIKVPTMKQNAKFALIETPEYKAISMPFKGKNVNFIVALPKEGKKLAGLENFLDDKQLSLMIKNLKQSRSEKVNIAIPKFKIEYETGLSDAFQTLGMDKAFSAKLADFGKMTGKKDALGLIWIAAIKHKAFLEINEEGGEAAAATGVIMVTRCAPPKSKPKFFKADRPFMFFITDKVTDSILFMGRVTNPSED